DTTPSGRTGSGLRRSGARASCQGRPTLSMAASSNRRSRRLALTLGTAALVAAVSVTHGAGAQVCDPDPCETTSTTEQATTTTTARPRCTTTITTRPTTNATPRRRTTPSSSVTAVGAAGAAAEPPASRGSSPAPTHRVSSGSGPLAAIWRWFYRSTTTVPT